VKDKPRERTTRSHGHARKRGPTRTRTTVPVADLSGSCPMCGTGALFAEGSPGLSEYVSVQLHRDNIEKERDRARTDPSVGEIVELDLIRRRVMCRACFAYSERGDGNLHKPPYLVKDLPLWVWGDTINILAHTVGGMYHMTAQMSSVLVPAPEPETETEPVSDKTIEYTPEDEARYRELKEGEPHDLKRHIPDDEEG